jgi:prepilin-type N-terminal cleavage/methylation domain-containing protein
VKGFTLLELLVVIVLICGLAAGLIVMIVGIIDGAKHDKTQGIVRAVSDACNAYRKEFQQWPPLSPYVGSANLHYYLGREFDYTIVRSGGEGSGAGLAPVTKKHKPFIEFRADWLLGGGTTDPNPPRPVCDAWNVALRYEIITTAGVPYAKITSSGGNQIFGDEDDISSEIRMR